MAYLPSKKKKSSAQLVSSGSSGTNAIAPQSVSSNQSSQPEKSNTGWTNLSQYLSANKGAGANMGNKVWEKVGDVANQAKATLSDFTNSMTKKATDQKIDNSNLISQINTSPVSVNKASFQKAQNHKYSGPTSFNTGLGYYGVNNTSKALSELTSGAGHQQAKNLVQGTYQRPDYKSGSKNLDAFLFGQAKENDAVRDDINRSREQYLNNLKTDTESVNQTIKDVQHSITDQKESLDKAYDSKRMSLADQFSRDTQAAAAKTETERAKYSGLLKDLSEGRASIDFNQDGNTDEKDQAVYNQLKKAGANDWERYLQTAKDYHLGDIATEANKADWQALLGLKDQSDSLDWKTGGRSAGVDSQMVGNANQFSTLMDHLDQRKTQALHQKHSRYEDNPSDPAYLWKAVRDNDYSRLRNHGISQEEFDLMRSYHNTVGDISKAGIGVNPVASIGDVITSEEAENLQRLAEAMGLKPIDTSRTRGTIQDKANTLYKLRNLIGNRQHQLNQEAERRKNAETRKHKNDLETIANPIWKGSKDVLSKIGIKVGW